MSKVNVASIILNWNNYDLTRACVLSFGKIASPDHEIIIIDNYSGSDATMRIQNEFPGYTYIYNDKNIGIAAGNNVGIKYAMSSGAEFILLCNNDIEILENDSLEKMVRYMKDHLRVGILGPRLVYPDGRLQTSVKSFPTLWNQFYFQWFAVKRVLRRMGIMRAAEFDPEKIQNVEYVMGAAFLIRRKMIDEIGLQDERFFCGFEDMDWCRMAQNSGWEVCYFPEVTIKHVHGATSGKLLSNFDYYFGEKLRYFKKHHSIFYTTFFRILVSAGAILRWLWGGLRWIFNSSDGNLAYVRSYGRLAYRIWMFPWAKNSPPVSPHSSHT